MENFEPREMLQQEPTLNFLDLPAEVRRMVYAHALANPNPRDLKKQLVPRLSAADKDQKRTVLALLLSCRQVRTEAQELLYSRCTFHLTTPLRLLLKFNGHGCEESLATQFHGNLKFIQRLAIVTCFLLCFTRVQKEDSAKQEPCCTMEVMEGTRLEGLLKCVIEDLPSLQHFQLTLDFDWIVWGSENNQMVAEYVLAALKPVMRLQHLSLKAHSGMDKTAKNTYRQVTADDMANFQPFVKILNKKIPTSEKWPVVEADGILI